MKTQFYFIFFLLVFLNAVGQPFQKHGGDINGYYHDLNIDIINDNSNNFIMAGNIFDTNFSTQLMTLYRKDQLGNTLWANTYTDSSIPVVRVLDVVNYLDKIFATGYVELNGPGTRSTFIADIDAIAGTVNAANFFDMLTPSLNSQGLKIIFTNSDADGDLIPDPGFVVGGTFTTCPTTDHTCATNLGFVLRTDFALNALWVIEMDNFNTTSGTFDYDFINGITETTTGFFLTGSVVGNLGTATPDQQGVLAHYIDFGGNFLWDSSYIFGNSQDVSVDAYFDNATQHIFMLCNYSQTHYFGVTEIDLSGNIIAAGSWYVTDPDLNSYAFKLTESITNPANLVVSGYDRDQTWQDASANSVAGQSNIFVYEFNKSTGAPVGQYTQYLVPHMEHSPEEFNFWALQQPLIYYPDMSIQYANNDGTGTHFFHVGYRTIPTGETWPEFIATDATLSNICINLRKNLTLNPLVYTSILATSGFIPHNFGPINIIANPLGFQDRDCNDTLLATNNPSKPKFVIYPNPAGEIVYIKGNNLQEFEIFDMLGKIVLKGKISSKKSISIVNLKSGIYFINIYDAYNDSQTFKLIKE